MISLYDPQITLNMSTYKIQYVNFVIDHRKMMKTMKDLMD